MKHFINKIIYGLLSFLILLSPIGTPIAIADSEPNHMYEEPVIERPIIEEYSIEELERNALTGTQSHNSNHNQSSTTTTVDAANQATTDNKANLDANTGYNEVQSNSSVGGLETGKIDGALNVVNLSNTTLAPGSSVGQQTITPTTGSSVAITPGTQRISLGNTATGPDSGNVNVTQGNSTLKITDLNDATLSNGLEYAANTGNNTVLNNTKIDSISTGNISLAANLLNLANLHAPGLQLSADFLTINNGLSGDLITPTFSNTMTGSGSDNANLTNSTGSTDVSVQQNANLGNYFNFQTNTGHNEIDKNTVVGDITTGDSTTKGMLVNVTNAIPVLYVVNVAGIWDGTILGVDPNSVIVNTMTGTDSTNQNLTTHSQNESVDIQNNADVANRITVSADTGHNTVGKNTVVGNITTGAVKISSTVANFINSLSNKTGQLRIFFINILGNWKGNFKSDNYVEPAKNETAIPTQTTGNAVSNDVATTKNDAKLVVNVNKNEADFENIRSESEVRTATSQSTQTTTETVAKNHTNESQQPANEKKEDKTDNTARMILAGLGAFILPWSLLQLIAGIGKFNKKI